LPNQTSALCGNSMYSRQFSDVIMPHTAVEHVHEGKEGVLSSNRWIDQVNADHGVQNYLQSVRNKLFTVLHSCICFFYSVHIHISKFNT